MRWCELRVGDVAIDASDEVYVLLETGEEQCWLHLFSGRRWNTTTNDDKVQSWWELIKGPAWGEE